MTFLLPALLVFIIAGVIYSLWQTTVAYGGLIGTAIKWIGVGMLFFALEAIDRALGDLGFVRLFSDQTSYIVHNIVLLLGLSFAGIGFSKLTRASK